MKAEIIAVGTELLLGQVVNTNATFLAQQLASLGFDVYYQSVVGDNPVRLEELLVTADQRSDLCVLCGGLGPTDDDLTRDVVAQHVGRELCIYQPALAKIEDRGKRLGRKLTSNNQRQALVIKDSTALFNPVGLAAGCLAEQAGNYYLLLPGPPQELQAMFQQEAAPLLKKILPQTNQLVSRVLRFFGIGESQLVTELADIIAKQVNPTVAPYAKQAEVTLRLTAQAASQATTEMMLDELETQILRRVGTFFYGYGDQNSLANEVVQLLKRKKQTLSIAESLTGGLAQSSIVEIPGASSVFSGGFVTYTAAAKEALLDISPGLLAQSGVVSEACAKAMAEQTRLKLNSDYALSFTGVAGPDELENKPAGTVWIGLACKSGLVTATLYQLAGERNNIRNSAVLSGLNQLRLLLLDGNDGIQ